MIDEQNQGALKFWDAEMLAGLQKSFDLADGVIACSERLAH